MYFSVEYKDSKIFLKIEKLLWWDTSYVQIVHQCVKRNNEKIVTFQNPLDMVSQYGVAWETLQHILDIFFWFKDTV